jgi:exodeoxyribonuclease V beta subunit
MPVTRATAPAPLQALAAPRTPTAPRAPAWWLSSYSALIRGPKRGGVDVGSAAETVPLEEYAEPRADEAGEGEEASMHAFPRGPSYGSFLHYLLEWAALVGFERALTDTERTHAEIARRAETAGLADWTSTLQAWLPEFLASALPLPDGKAVSLRDLPQARARPEFAFMLEANAVDLGQLDAVVTEHMLPGVERPRLTQKHLNGMLSGFIDLVFEHEGTWYTLDYKSNHLAENAAGYTEAVMAEEMARHRYDLQAALYLLALHRFLRSRLPDYDPKRHIGGVIYPFLRGVGQGTGVLIARPDVALLEALDALFAGDLQHAA